MQNVQESSFCAFLRECGTLKPPKKVLEPVAHMLNIAKGIQ